VVLFMIEIGIVLGSVNVVELFQKVLVPILLISGIGLFILVIQTRYGRIVDSLRTINNERRELVKITLMKRTSKFEKIWNDNRLQSLQEQMSILVKRGKLLKDSLRFLFIVIFTSITSSLLLFIEQIINTPMSLAVLFLFLLAMIMLLLACINVIKEVSNSYSAVIYDIDMHLPQNNQIQDNIDLFAILDK